MPWITDGQVAGSLDRDGIHETQEIKKFLTKGNDQYLILVASKGMGKTTLMRLKREQLGLSDKSAEGLTLIPSNSETDIVSLPSSVHNSLYVALQNVAYWRALWETAIMVSVLVSSRLSPDLVGRQKARRDASELALPGTLTQDVSDVLADGLPVPQKPSQVLDILLSQSSVDFETFRKNGFGKLTYLFRDVIVSGCAIFIDSLDQELEDKFPGDLEVWRAGQLGLMRAAWELNRLNRHVKTFVSVRQEAWASFTDPVKGNMAGSTLVIKYNTQDLRKIFELAIITNDGPYSLAQFIGFSRIKNYYIQQEEDAFEFIRRHTLGVPRWLAILGGEIANIRDGRNVITDPEHLEHHQRSVADVVNNESAQLTRDYLASEMNLFFKGCAPVEHVKLLLRPVQSTVLTLPNITRLSERYTEAVITSSGALKTGVDHPFCLLVNLGLVGYSESNGVSSHPVIRFRMPYEFDWNYQDILPPAAETTYFLHPAMHQLARDSSKSFRFSGVKISNGRLITDEDRDRINDRRFSIFVSYSSLDWDTGVGRLIEELEDSLNEMGEFFDLWLDRNRMEAARHYLAQMHDGNLGSTFMLFCASQNSVISQPVLNEIAERKDLDFSHKRHTLFTVIMDDLQPRDLPLGLRADHVLMQSSGNFNVAKLAEQLARRRTQLFMS